MRKSTIASLVATSAAILLPAFIASADIPGPGWRTHPTPPIPTPGVSPSSSASPSPTASSSSTPDRPTPHAAGAGFDANPDNGALFYAGIAVAGAAVVSLTALRAIGKRTA